VTGQFPKRRETEQQAERRVSRMVTEEVLEARREEEKRLSLFEKLLADLRRPRT
jgi:hypothetical protein